MTFRLSIILLSFLLFRCSPPKKEVYNVELPNLKISFSFSPNRFDLTLDTTIVYIGNPVLTCFSNNNSKEKYRIYLGTKDPIPDWKYTFDFREEKISLKEQVHKAKLGVFENEGDLSIKKCPGNFVEYYKPNSTNSVEAPEMGAIEARIVCKNGIIVNIDYTNGLIKDPVALRNRFETITRDFIIVNVEFR